LGEKAKTPETFSSYLKEIAQQAQGQHAHHREQQDARRFDDVKAGMAGHLEKIASDLETKDGLILSPTQREIVLDALATAEIERAKKGHRRG
jgi:hypothetical protein